jgi:hypothetical protein
MKNKFVFIALFNILITLVLVSACQKNSSLPPVSENQDKLQVVGFSENKVPFEMIHKNPEDAEDEKIALSKIAFARELLKKAQDKDFVESIVDKAKKNKGFVNVDDDLQKFFQTKIQTSSNLDVNGACPLIHNNIYYKYKISVPNYATCGSSNLPVISPGVDIGQYLTLDNLDATGGDDIVFAWYIHESGAISEINISESQAMASIRPIIIVCLELCNIQANGVSKENFIKKFQASSIVNQAETDQELNIERFRINNRYDRSNYSEYRIAGNVGQQNLDGTVSVLQLLPGSDNFIFVADLRKNYIGGEHQSGVPFARWQVAHRNFIFYNGYERDWYATNFSLGTGELCGLTGSNCTEIFLAGYRSYFDEWYSHNPDFQAGTEFKVTDITNSSMNQRFNFDDSKGLIEVSK